ncbi:hypothetical protein DXG01_015047, partial [Tephrocybe rancida]
AFLFEDDINDSISDALVEAITSKVALRLDDTVDHLSKAADFFAATDTSQAQTTVTLGEISSQLSTVTTSLDTITSKLSSTVLSPPSLPAPPPPSWASIASAFPSLPPSTFNPNASPQQTNLQQCLLRSSRTILIDVNAEDAPADRSPTGTANILKNLNKALSDIDAAESTFSSSQDGIAPPPACTIVKGLTSLKNGAFLLELDSDDSASRFRKYANDPLWELLSKQFGNSATIKEKPHCLIV